jgi:hypothetical protein
MPWSVKKSDECPVSKPWACVKDDDGEIEGCHASRSDAIQQQRALYQSEAADAAEALRQYRRSRPGRR